LHGDGTNGAQNNTFLDSSTNNFTITRNGNTTQGSFSPYGSNWSNYVASGSYLSIANNTAFNLSGVAFTIEAWVFCTGLSGGYLNFIAGKRLQSTPFNWSWVFYLTNTGVPAFSNGTVAATAASAITFNTWVHLAAVCNGTTVQMYVNGVASGSAVTVAVTEVNTPLTIGNYPVDNPIFNGYISNLRLVKGTALYTSNFTPSTIPLTAISGTSLLTCADNRFVDDSANNFAITVAGTPSVQRFNPFGTSTAYSTATIGGSGYFPSTGDYITIPSSASTNMLGGQFTIELWFYTGYFDPSIDAKLLVQDDGNNNSQNFQIVMSRSNGAVNFTTFSSSSRGSFWSISGPALPKNQWNHVAISYNGTTTYLYVNGVYSSSSTNAYWSGASIQTVINNWSAGISQTSGNAVLAGYVGDVRMIKGTALYSGTGNITVPTTPFSAVTNTSLLLNYTNAGIYDNAMMNNLQTVGNAQISTSVVKYGTGSMSFNGSTDLLRCLETPNLLLQGNFTVEAWVYPTTITGSSRTILFLENGANGATFYISATGILNLDVAGVANYTLGSTAVTTNSWQHIAFVRSGTTLTGYINGTSSGTATVSAFLGSSGVALVGANSNAVGAPFAGYIDDLRITKGYARYTANFTPPTAAFPNIGPY